MHPGPTWEPNDRALCGAGLGQRSRGGRGGDFEHGALRLEFARPVRTCGGRRSSPVPVHMYSPPDDNAVLFRRLALACHPQCMPELCPWALSCVPWCAYPHALPPASRQPSLHFRGAGRPLRWRSTGELSSLPPDLRRASFGERGAGRG